MQKSYALDKGKIIIKRDLTKLDIFVKNFLKVLKQHSDYLIVSGFVSVCTGRARGTEDVDILIPVLGKEKFNRLFKDLEKNNYWCYQGDEAEEVYSYLKNLDSVRFAEKNTVFPNIELIPFDETKKTKLFEFNHPQNIIIRDFEFKIPPLEFEILYKEMILKGKKDIEDAKHLRTFFSDMLKGKKFKEYGLIIKADQK